MSAVAIHQDCVTCLTIARPELSSAEAVMVVLMMLGRGVPGEQIVRDLCFAHRREHGDNVKRWEDAEP